MDNTTLFRKVEDRDGWRRIAAGLTFMSPQRPSVSRDLGQVRSSTLKNSSSGFKTNRLVANGTISLNINFRNSQQVPHMKMNTTGDYTLNHAQCSKTLLASQIRKAFQNVTVAGGPRESSTGKRNYSKTDYCLYCKNRNTSKISSHYLAVHSTEPKVTAMMELPCGSKERKRHLTLLQNEGNHLHNCEHYTFEKPSKSSGQLSTVKMVVLVVLTVAVMLHTVALVSHYLARFRPTIVHKGVYQYQAPLAASSDVDMGLWKICRKAWRPDCVSWARSTHLDVRTGAIQQLEAPGWLLAAQGASITGLVVAVITDVIVIVYLIRPNNGVRLFPCSICLGSLIAGILVFISSACLAFNYKGIPRHMVGLLTSDPAAFNGMAWLYSDFSFSLNWAFALEILAIVLMWLSGLLINLRCKPHIDKNKVDTNKRLFTIFTKLFPDTRT